MGWLNSQPNPSHPRLDNIIIRTIKFCQKQTLMFIKLYIFKEAILHVTTTSWRKSNVENKTCQTLKGDLITYIRLRDSPGRIVWSLASNPSINECYYATGIFGSPRFTKHSARAIRPNAAFHDTRWSMNTLTYSFLSFCVKVRYK